MLHDESPIGATQRLQDMTELLRLALDAPALATEETRTRIEVLRGTLRSHGPSQLATRLGLRESEMNVVWLLAALAVDPNVRRLVAGLEQTATGDPTLDTIRRIAYGANLSHHALRELGEGGKLRTLQVIERSDAGGRELHEHLQTWALSRRVLACLHEEPTASTPALAGIVRAVGDGPTLDRPQSYRAHV